MKNNRLLPLPPGNLGLPLIGQTFLMRKPGFRQKYRQKYDEFYLFIWQGGKSIYFK